jgi:diguanylate cyclase (GGDEF)-like protein
MESLLAARERWRRVVLVAAYAAVPVVFLLDLAVGPGLTLAAFSLLPLLTITLTSRSWWQPYLVALGLSVLIYFWYQSFPATILHSPLAAAWRVLAQLFTSTVLVLVTQGVLWTALRLNQYASALDAERRRAWMLATTDPLTGLANRRHFDDRLQAELRRCSRTNLPVAVLLLDLDHFKEINDHWGHAAGDTALCRVAELLRNELRASDLPARLGGDEFAVLLPETSAAQAEFVAQKLRDRLALARLRTAGQGPPHPGASVGVAASMPGQALESGPGVSAASGLLARADHALYAAKQTRQRAAHLAISRG